MSLIELIGVLAIIAVLASIVLPALIKQTDNVVAAQEGTLLQSFANAFQSSITRNRRIAGVAGNDWATNIANELGMNVTDVNNNIRRLPRAFLIDTNGFGTLTLPYTQTDTGTLTPTNSGFSPRVMIVSSLGVALPGAVIGGTAISTTDFTNLWNWDSTSAHFPKTGVWSTFTGNPYDITVQRLNLSPLLVNLLLSYSSTTRNSATPFYSIDNTVNPIVPVVSTTNVMHGYFLQNSVLSLYYSNVSSGVVLQDSLQILKSDSFFVFDQNKWLNNLGNPTNVTMTGSGGSGGSGGPGIANFDFTDMVNGFLNAPGPTATTTNLSPSGLQTNLVQSFINYMTSYTNWAASGAPYPSSAYNTAVANQAALMSNVNTLISSITVH